jgi:hypothetical protein
VRGKGRGVEDRSPLRRGDVVALRSPREILETLDGAASLAGVPFMPEMLGCFGRRFTVTARVERACDTITGSGPLHMPDTVLLDGMRCDGGGHGGCQAACLVYWKESWLRRVGDGERHVSFAADESFERLRALAVGGTRPETPPDGDADVYRCQATELLRSTTPLGWWNARSFLREVTCGNVSPWTFARVSVRLVLEEIVWRLGLRKPTPFQRYGDSPAEPEPWGVHPGQRVRVRPASEIRDTLDASGKLRGLWFDREMLPYCGTEAVVKAKVERFVDEKTGTMVNLASDCFILDGVVCEGHLSRARWFCPRAIYSWWREAWLEPGAGTGPAGSRGAQTGLQRRSDP